MKAEKSKKFQRERNEMKEKKEGLEERRKNLSSLVQNINYLYLPPNIPFEDTFISPRNGKLKSCYKGNSP